MPDTEMFKAVVQGGSFALVVLLFCWILFRLEPRIREMIEKKDAMHADTIKAITEASAATIQKTVTENRTLVEGILNKFATTAETAARECREERKEWMEAFQREGELNRKARHELANRMTEAMATAYATRDRDRDDDKCDSKESRPLPPT